jgi:hypothetical protein
MPDNYDLLPDLARLLDAALRAGWSALPYVDRLAEGLGLGPSGGPEEAERLLRAALGMPPAGTCELVRTGDGTCCAEPAVVRLTGACLHGHVAERQVCEGHKVPGEPLWCRTCYQQAAPDAHRCPVVLFPAGAARAAGTENR